MAGHTERAGRPDGCLRRRLPRRFGPEWIARLGVLALAMTWAAEFALPRGAAAAEKNGVPAATFPLAGAGSDFGPLAVPRGVIDLGPGLASGPEAGPIALAAVIEPGIAGLPDTLAITASIEDGWHIYSLTQAPGGPLATRIRIAADSPRPVTGGFLPDEPPVSHAVTDIPAWNGLVVEEHAGTVTWRAPVAEGGGTVRGDIVVQLCRDGACLPPETIPFTADPAPASDLVAASHRPERTHATISARLQPGPPADAGGFRTLVIAIEPDEGWHAYAPSSATTGGVGEGRPTILALAAGGTPPRIRSLVATRAVRSAVAEIAAAGGVDGPVVLELRLDPAGDAAFDLLLGLQTCTASSCDPPAGVRLAIEPGTGERPGRLGFSAARYAEARAASPLAVVAPAGAGSAGEGSAAPGAPAPQASPPAGAPPLSLPLALVMGLAGGLILNLMPCVLPVLGLKLMSLAQQSGRARREVFETNLWYCGGVFAVFFALATASVAANIGLATANLAWGEQFTSARFNITMAGIVFAFALSFLGVWELPIPGFIGEQAGHVQTREGPTGAFLKGVLSTVLATPCSGPFLGPVLGFTLTQPTIVTYAVFASVATGMALPYILVGVFPGLVRFIPRPGGWMTTFKELLGFVMLGTVAFLFTFLPATWFVPTFVLLIGIWMGCWWVGRAQERSGAVGFGRWVQAATIATAVGSGSFLLLGPVDSVIDWQQPFTRARVAELNEQGSTVLVDFSADWCLTCKANLRFAIETGRVREAIERNRVVPVLADWTEPSEEIKLALESLGSKSIPVLAIFPGGEPGRPRSPPIVLRDLLTEAQVLEAIERAGPSCCPPPEIRSAAAGGASGR